MARDKKNNGLTEKKGFSRIVFFHSEPSKNIIILDFKLKDDVGRLFTSWKRMESCGGMLERKNYGGIKE